MSVLNMGEKFEDSTGELFPTAPAGVYEARVSSVKETVSGENGKHPGTPMWIIEFALEDAEHENIRVTMFQQIPAGEGSEWMEEKDITRKINELKRLWMACGLTSEGGNIDSDDLLNAQLRLDVDVEEYKGKMKNTVRDVLAI